MWTSLVLSGSKSKIPEPQVRVERVVDERLKVAEDKAATFLTLFYWCRRDPSKGCVLLSCSG